MAFRLGWVLACFAGAACAGTISLLPLPPVNTDAHSGLSATNRYLCALDFGPASETTIINGVHFQRCDLRGGGEGSDSSHPVFTGVDGHYGGLWKLAGVYSGDQGFGSHQGSHDQADGNTRLLLNGFAFLSGVEVSVGSSMTLECWGLTPGKSYSLRYYLRDWTANADDPRRPIVFTFFGEETAQSYSANPLDIDAGGAKLLRYDFIAASNSVSMHMGTGLAGNGPHLYGATLQVDGASQPFPPVIVEQPKDGTGAATTSFSLQVSATGPPPLTYQWLKGGMPVAWATNRTLSFGYLTLSQAGAYQSIVANSEGSTTSGIAILRVLSPPVSPGDPADADAALLHAARVSEEIIAAADASRGVTNFSARWIGPPTSSVNQWICYRKQFSLPNKPARAVARIAADSKYWLWVNGRIAVREGGLKRGPNSTDTWFDELDLAPLLQAGSNTVAILHWYFGKHGFSHNSSGTAGILLDLDAKGTRVGTDGSWRMLIHPAFQSATVVPQPNYRLPESSLRYDARLDLGEWTAPGFDDHAWGTTVDRGSAGSPPWGNLWRRSLPMWMEAPLQEFTSTSASGGSPVTWIGKLPVNLRFTPWLDIEAPAGEVITLKTDASTPELALAHEYVTRAGRQSFEFPAWINGHEARFVIPAGVKVHGLKFRPHVSDTKLSGVFECNDDFFTSLWNKAVNTLRVNMIDTWTDCPDRERANWIGDTVVDLGQTPYVFDACGELAARKSLLDLCGWQRADLTLYAPTPAGNWTGELPSQSLAAVGKYGVLRYYRNTGDLTFIQQCYPAIKAYLLNVWQTNAVGLVVHRPGGWDWHDWGDNVDPPLLYNTWYLLGLEAAAEMAVLVGKPEDAIRFNSRATGIRQQFNPAFWNGSEYRSPGFTGLTDDRGNAMAVVAGLTDATQREALRRVLTNSQHASPYMEKYVLEALFALDYPDDALARMRSRYAGMVSSSSTTLWELFPTGGTFNHGWSGGPLTILAESVIGMNPTSPGFATFDVRPELGNTLTRIGLDQPSRHGLIRILAARNGRDHRLALRVPPGSSGQLFHPTNAGALSGLVLLAQGGASVALDETAVTPAIEVSSGQATLMFTPGPLGHVSKTGAGALKIASDTLLEASQFENQQGDLTIPAGSGLVVPGNMTNTGTMHLYGDASLSVKGIFRNTGVLDIMAWRGTLPPGLINDGVVLDRNTIKVLSCQVTGENFSAEIHGYPGHTYFLQCTPDPASPAWTPIGQEQAGTNERLTLTHTNGLSRTGAFYRVVIEPPHL